MVITTATGLKKLIIWKFPGKPVKIEKSIHPELAEFVEKIDALSENIWQTEKDKRKQSKVDRQALLFLDRVYDMVIDAIIKQKMEEFKQQRKEFREHERQRRKNKGSRSRVRQPQV